MFVHLARIGIGTQFKPPVATLKVLGLPELSRASVEDHLKWRLITRDKNCVGLASFSRRSSIEIRILAWWRITL